MAMRGFLGRLIFGTIYIAFALADEKSLILESNQHNINENKNLRGRILAQWSSSMNDESNVEALNTNHMPSANPHLNFEPMGSGLLQHPNSATRDLKSYSRRRHRRHGRSNSNTKAKNSLSKRAFRSACHAVAHANIVGHNLPHGHLRNITRWTDCCAACQSRQGCVAWALRLDGNVHQKGCFLKSGKYRVIKNVRYAAYGLNPGSLSPPRSSPHSLPPPTPKQRNPASRGTAGLPPFGGVAPVPTNPKPIVQSPSPKPFESPPQVSAPVYYLPPSPSPIHSPPSPPPSPPPYPPSPPPPSPPLPPPSPPPPPPPAPPPPSPSPPPPAPPRSLLCTPTTARLQHGVAGKRVGTAYYHGCSNQVSSDVECCAACQVNPSCLGFFYERADCSGFGGPFDTGICWQIEDTIATFPSANLTAGTLYSRLPY